MSILFVRCKSFAILYSMSLCLGWLDAGPIRGHNPYSASTAGTLGQAAAPTAEISAIDVVKVNMEYLDWYSLVDSKCRVLLSAIGLLSWAVESHLGCYPPNQ